MNQLRINRFVIVVLVGLAPVSCFRETKGNLGTSSKSVAADIPAGELAKAAATRGLSVQDVLAAVKTYVPSGGRDTHIVLMTAGSAGRLAIVGLPSMRIIKYVGVFTPEPWQGFAYDDESKGILRASARGEVSYSFGLSGRPAASRTAGSFDGRAVFVGDGANARLAVVDLDDYEAKQVVTNPHFHTAHPSLSITENSEFVLQTTAAPELLDGDAIPAAGRALTQALKGAATLWHTTSEEDKIRLHAEHSVTLELPPYRFGRSQSGLGPSKDFFFIPASCAEPICMDGRKSFLEVIGWKRAVGIESAGRRRIAVAGAVLHRALFQYRLLEDPEAFALSPSGKRGALTFRSGSKILILNLEKIAAADPTAMTKDAYGVPTELMDDAIVATVEVGGPSVDLAFVEENVLYATVQDRLVKIDVPTGKLTETHKLGYAGGRILVPGFGSAHPSANYAVVTNTRPHGRYQSVGPRLGMNAELFDLSASTLSVLYDMSVPQATALDGEILPADRIESIVRYKPGTDTRTSQESPFVTMPGQERVERNGRRVEVFGTLIRSHITPEIVEVEQGDIVTFHMTNLEQAQDQTHGFTVDTYNVHGSWEPGKTASVTLIADRPGVFPYYCTEFCSALHLEMEGYMLVKPKGEKKILSEGGAK